MRWRLGLAALLLSCARPSLANPAPEPSWATYFYTAGREVIAESTGTPLLFRGIAAPGMEYAQFGPHYPGRENVDYTMNSPALYTRLASAGFNVVRVPFDWGAVIPQPYARLHTTYLEQLNRIVNDYAAPRRLYVILDMHSFLRYWDAPSQARAANDDPVLQALLVETWRLLARHFAANPTVLGYEIMNEPNPQVGDSQWPTIAQRVIEAIRTEDTRHLIFVDGRGWSGSERWEELNGPRPFVTDPITPPRLVYVAHVYFNPDDNDQYVGARPDLALLERRLAPLASWADRNLVPVWIGESGVPDTPPWAALLDCAFERYYDPLSWGHLYWEASEWSRDATRLGPFTLGTLQRHLGRPPPPDALPAPRCAELPALLDAPDGSPAR